MRAIRLARLHLVLPALLALFVICPLTPVALAQDDPTAELGMKPYGAFQGGNIDNVNLLNESLNVHIPLVSYPQKGGKLNLSFSVVYLQPTLSYIYDNCTNPNDNRTCNQDWSLTPGHNGAGGGTAIVLDGFPNLSSGAAPPPVGTTIAMPDGTSHPFSTLAGAGNLTGDGSAYLYSSGSEFKCGLIYLTPYWILDKIGNKYLYATTCGEAFASATDTDGNIITVNYSQINGALVGTSLTDTVSRNIPFPGGTQTNNLTGCTGSLPMGTYAYLWSIPGPNGATVTYKVCTGAVTINLQGCQNANGDTTSRCIFEPVGSRIQSIVLPDGTAWTFGYDSSNSPSQYAYGDLTSITFPTGGTITYVWGSLPFTTTSACENPATQFMRRGVQTRTLNANDGQGPHQWTYSQSFGSSQFPPLTTTVLDPVGNQTLHTITALLTSTGAECAYYETLTQYYQGTQTLLKTVATQYSFTNTNLTVSNIFPSSVTTTWPNNQVSKVQTAYALDGPGGSSYGDITTKSEYDYGNGSPGSLLRQTVTTYQYQSSSSYKTANIVALPATVQIKDGGGTQRAYKTYGYDESNGSPQCVCGNQTSIHKWLNTTGGYFVTNNVYGSNGLITSITDPKGNATMYVYTPSSCPVNSGYAGSGPNSVKNALSQTTYYCYDVNTGLLVSTRDPNNRTTSYSYDEMLRATQINYPDGGLSTLAYPNPNEVMITDEITGTTNKVSYSLVDGVGREIRHAVSNGESLAYDESDVCYDGLGRMSFTSYPFQDSGPFHTSRSCGSPEAGDLYQYDGLNRTMSVTHSDGSSVVTSYTGRATSIQDEGNGAQRVQKVSQVDGTGRLSSVCEVTSSSLTVGITGSTTPTACGQDISATGFLTAYGYDALDNLISVAQTPLNTRSFVYDSQSRLVSIADPESGATIYTRDSVGNVITKTDARGVTTCFGTWTGTTCTATGGYDALNRVLMKTYSDGTPAVSFTYDQSSALGVTLTNTVGQESSESTAGSSPTGSVFSYDPMGRIVNNSQCTPQNCSTTFFSFTYAYDLLGDTTSNVWGLGLTLTYSYNQGARLTQLVSSANDTQHPPTLYSNAHYNAAGSLTSVVFGNGVNESRAYDGRLRLVGITDGSIYSLTIPANGYAPDSEILAANDSVNGNWTYIYDPFNRLTKSTPSVQTWWYTYVYDRFGNRWQQNLNGTGGSGPAPNYTFDANNHIAGTSGVSYDAAGNMTGDGVHTYFYDAENRISQVDGTRGNCSTATACYVYDAEGRRVRKITTAGGTVDFLYDRGSHEIAQISSAGTWTRGEIYADERHLVSYLSSPMTYFIYSDWLGTERVRSPYVPSTNEVCTSLPFGDALTCNGIDLSPMHFTGKEHDGETGLENFGVRYDSSSMGRFMSPDPASIGATDDAPQTWDAYAYAANDPLDATDAYGLDCLYVIGNALYYSVGSCVPGYNGRYIDGSLDPNSIEYDPHTGTVKLNYTPYNPPADLPGFPKPMATDTIRGVFAESAVTDEDRFNAVSHGMRMGEQGIKAGTLFMAENAAGSFLGRGIGLGLEAWLASRAASAGAGLAPGLVFNAGRGLLGGEAELSIHAAQQAAARGVTQAEISEALTHVPKQYAGDGSVVRFIGKAAEVRVNKVTGTIVTVIRKLAPNAPSPIQ